MAGQPLPPSEYLDLTGEETRHVIDLTGEAAPAAAIMTQRAAAVPGPNQMARSIVVGYEFLSSGRRIQIRARLLRTRTEHKDVVYFYGGAPAGVALRCSI